MILLKGDIFDIIMFYQAYKPARAFFAKTIEYAGAEKLKQDWELAIKDLPITTTESMMMMSASHDTPRLPTSFFNKGKYKYQVKPTDNIDYKTGKPDVETFKRVMLYLTYQFTMPGAPQIWAGDEMGMWGGDDPDCRKPLWWDDMTFENESNDPFKVENASYPVSFNYELNDFYKKLIQLRKKYLVLRTGELTFVKAEGDLLILKRSSEKEIILVIFNNSNLPIQLPADTDFEGTDVLKNMSIHLTEGSEIAPLTSQILQINRN